MMKESMGVPFVLVLRLDMQSFFYSIRKTSKTCNLCRPIAFLLVGTDRARAVQVSATELGLHGISGTLWRAETSPAAQDAVDDK